MIQENTTPSIYNIGVGGAGGSAGGAQSGGMAYGTSGRVILPGGSVTDTSGSAGLSMTTLVIIAAAAGTAAYFIAKK